MKGFERCFKVEDTWRRQNLHAAILRPPAKRIQIKLYEPHLGKEKPVMGNIEPLLGITKPAEGLNKPCQGNVNGRKSFAAEGFNVKIPFISRTYTKAVAISFRQSHTRIRNLVKYHPRVVFTESFHAMVSTDEGVLNSRSLHRHIEDIRKGLNYSSVDVNIFSETRLNCSDKDTDYAITGYTLFRNDNQPTALNTRPYGGTAV